MDTESFPAKKKLIEFNSNYFSLDSISKFDENLMHNITFITRLLLCIELDLYIYVPLGTQDKKIKIALCQVTQLRSGKQFESTKWILGAFIIRN